MTWSKSESATHHQQQKWGAKNANPNKIATSDSYRDAGRSSGRLLRRRIQTMSNQLRFFSGRSKSKACCKLKARRIVVCGKEMTNRDPRHLFQACIDSVRGPTISTLYWVGQAKNCWERSESIEDSRIGESRQIATQSLRRYILRRPLGIRLALSKFPQDRQQGAPKEQPAKKQT
jgi:hypothetical protein